jgi:cobalt-zinc-cadmium efflux system membrane fusion protein
VVAKGQVLFTVEAADMVQAQNDLVAAMGGVNKARSQLQLQQTIEKRQRELYESKAIALKEWQSAQNELVTAQNDLRGAEGALEAVRNRLAILGRTEAEVAGFLDKGGRMSPETPIFSPIAGTVISRRIGPGQYVSASSGDAPYTIGDLSSVWLIANVREVEVPAMQIGQPLTFKVLAFPDRTFSARVSFVGASVDPGTRRVVVRAQVDNLDGALKPEMFASIRITQGVAQMSPAVPKEAVIYEADTARVWALMPDGSVELRRVTTGLVSGQLLQITSGLKVGDRIITKGSLFIDRLASGEGS